MSALIVTTGFSPWAQHSRNTSWDCLNCIERDAFSPWILERERLPVVWSEVQKAAQAIVARKPAAAICFGQCPGPQIRLERLAQWRASALACDAQGKTFSASEAAESQPLQSTLPLSAIGDALDEAAIPFRLSDDAGDFLCNYLFFRLMTEIQQAADFSPLAGFIHVPQAGDMPDEQISIAIRLCIETTLSHAADRADLADPPRLD